MRFSAPALGCIIGNCSGSAVGGCSASVVGLPARASPVLCICLQGRKQQEAAFVPEVEEEDPQDKQLAGGMHQQPGQATQPGAQATVQQQQQQSDAHAQGMTSAGEHPLADSSAATDAPEDEGGSAAAAAPAEAAAPPPLLLKQVSTGASLCCSRQPWPAS